MMQPPAKQSGQSYDHGYKIKRNDLFHVFPSSQFPAGTVIAAQLRLWQKPVNEQRVHPDHDQSQNYDDIIHNLGSFLTKSLPSIVGLSLLGFAFYWAKIADR
ncbi:MAG TPA: hypothetical protein VKS98_05835 [Chthoniobacterales bacterium]|nr:hypothetical protein [Chthoniobacterales bacterium]